MAILEWNKPAKAQSTTDHNNSCGFEGGPAGGYMPNMDEINRLKWKAKLVGKTTDHPQVEIRKGVCGTQLTMIVSLGNGYNYKGYKADNKNDPKKETFGWNEYGTRGINVHIAANGGIRMTFAELNELQTAVQEAREFLESLVNTTE